MAEKYDHEKSIKELETLKGKTLEEILKDGQPNKVAVAQAVFSWAEKNFGIKAPDEISVMFQKKQEFIKNQSDKKQDSMRDFAIKRDATLFVGYDIDLMSDQEFEHEEDSEKFLKELHKKWLKYFEEIYTNGK